MMVLAFLVLFGGLYGCAMFVADVLARVVAFFDGRAAARAAALEPVPYVSEWDR